MTSAADNIDWVGLGQMLREQRDAGELSRDSAANALCLSGHQIRALECGSALSFPGYAARSWCARRYATLLGLDWDRLVQSQRSEELETAIETGSPPETGMAKPVPGSAGRQFGIGLAQGAAVLLLVIAVAIGFGTKSAAPPDPAPIADGSLKSAPPAPAASAGVALAVVQTAGQDERRVDAKIEAALAASTTALADKAQTAAGKVIGVQGIDPRKSPDYFFINSKQPSVLVKKKWRNPSAEIRLEFAQGAARRVPIGADEVIRVEEGKDIEIFYQGRMLPLQIIASGDWARFIPKSAGEGN